MIYIVISLFFFFFQAEDGIRVGRVTGVQTCALPISGPHRRLGAEPVGRSAQQSRRRSLPGSEERRVGKECRFRWSPDHKKKKNTSFGYFEEASDDQRILRGLRRALVPG